MTLTERIRAYHLAKDLLKAEMRRQGQRFFHIPAGETSRMTRDMVNYWDAQDLTLNLALHGEIIP